MWVFCNNLELLLYLNILFCNADYHHEGHEEHEERICLTTARFLVRLSDLHVLRALRGEEKGAGRSIYKTKAEL